MKVSQQHAERGDVPGAGRTPDTAQQPSLSVDGSSAAPIDGASEPGTRAGDAAALAHSAPAGSPLAALCLIARLHHVAAEPAQLCHALGWAPSHEPNTQDFLLAAKHLGLKARLARSSAERLTLTPLPALTLLRDELGTIRTVVLAQCDGKRVLFQDPSGAIQGGRPVIEPLEAFARQRTHPHHQPRVARR